MTQVAEHINEVKKDYETSLLVQVMYVCMSIITVNVYSLYVRMCIRDVYVIAVDTCLRTHATQEIHIEETGSITGSITPVAPLFL